MLATSGKDLGLKRVYTLTLTGALFALALASFSHCRPDRGSSLQAAPGASRGTYVNAIGGLRMRKEPDVNAEVVTLIPDGSALTVLETGPSANIADRYDHWQKVSYRDKEGWVFGGFVSDEGAQCIEVQDMKSHPAILQMNHGMRQTGAQPGRNGLAYIHFYPDGTAEIDVASGRTSWKRSMSWSLSGSTVILRGTLASPIREREMACGEICYRQGSEASACRQCRDMSASASGSGQVSYTITPVGDGRYTISAPAFTQSSGHPDGDFDPFRLLRDSYRDCFRLAVASR